MFKTSEPDAKREIAGQESPSARSIAVGWRIYGLAALTGLLSFLTYVKALKGEFIAWDDDEYIYNNPFIRSFDLEFLRWSFFEFHSANWHPLTWLSHGFDYWLWGLDAFGHHLTSILLHALNSGIVVVVVATLIGVRYEIDRIRTRSVSSDRVPSAAIAGVLTGLLFGLHPVHVESVAWVSERKDLLCALFFLLSVWAYARFAFERANAEAGGRGSPSWQSGWYWSSLLIFALALMSKPMAITLPIVLLLLDIYPFRSMRNVIQVQNRLLEKLPFIALSLFSGIVTVMAQQSVGAMSAGLSLGVRPLVAANALIAYLAKMGLPIGLVPYYSYPSEVSFWTASYGGSVLLVIGITLACVIRARRSGLWLAGWSYYVVTLLPVLGLVQVGAQAMADRYTYLPSLGPFVILGILGAHVHHSVTQHSVARHSLLPQQRWVQGLMALFLGAVVLMPLIVLSQRQIAVWKGNRTFWNYVIENTPERGLTSMNGRSIGHYNLACVHSLKNQTQQACEHLQQSLDSGFDGWRHIQFDPDFDNIRNSECYRVIMSGR